MHPRNGRIITAPTLLLTSLVTVSGCTSLPPLDPTGLDAYTRAIGTFVPDQDALEEELPAEASTEQPAPWTPAGRARYRSDIDPAALQLVRHLFPDTGVGQKGEGKHLIFETVQERVCVQTPNGRFHAIEVRRARWNMLAPRGQFEIAVVDEWGRFLGSEQWWLEWVHSEGTVLVFGNKHTSFRVDLADPTQVAAWRDHKLGHTID